MMLIEKRKIISHTNINSMQIIDIHFFFYQEKVCIREWFVKYNTMSIKDKRKILQTGSITSKNFDLSKYTTVFSLLSNAIIEQNSFDHYKQNEIYLTNGSGDQRV